MKKNRIAIGNPDLDGVSSYILASVFEIEFDDILIVDYDFFQSPTHMDYAMEFKEIFFIDFAPTKEMFDEMINRGVYFWVFDHHESDQAVFLKDVPEDNSKYKIFIDYTEVGTSLFFKKYLLPMLKRVKPVVFRFVHLVRTYDAWDVESSDWEEALSLNRVCYGQHDWNQTGIVAYQQFIDKQVRKIQELSEWTWTKVEKEIIESAKKRELEILKESREKLQIRDDHHGKLFGIFDCGSKISLTAHALLKEYPEFDFIIVVNTYHGINGKLSFRSKSFNCNTLALANGHDAAAGGQVSLEDAIKLLEGEYWCVAYKGEEENFPKKMLKKSDL